MRQGFMKPLKRGKAPRVPKPSAGCELCQDWHEQGKHRYVVWSVTGDEPLGDGKPFADLKAAQKAAETRAVTLRSDQAISRGRNPTHPGFKIVGRYRSGSGARIV